MGENYELVKFINGKLKAGRLLLIRKTTKRMIISINYSKNSILLTKATALPSSPDEVVSMARAFVNRIEFFE
jgi:hypothetical protein